MRTRIAVGVLGGALAAAGLAAGAAQTGQQRPPVFRAGAVLVKVDVYPRRDGRILDVLSRDDFEVREDGVLQTIDTIQFIRVPPLTPDAELRDPVSIADSERQAADPRNRLFVIYLDLFRTTLFGSHNTRALVTAFLSRTLGPADLFAVMTPEVPASRLTFARRTETIEAELARYWDWGERDRQGVFPRSELERRLLSCAEGEALVNARREDLSATSLEALVNRLAHLRDERKNILLFSEGWTPRRGQVGAGGRQPPGPPPIGIGPGGTLGIGTSLSGWSDAAWCEAQRVRLASIDYDARFRDLLVAARRANVAFYPIDVGGLRTRPAAGRTDTLVTLAAETGGRAIVNTNDLTTGVQAISDDLSAFYLLGYYSTNTAADGRYRRIDVRVKRPGVSVTARRCYLAPTEEMRRAAMAPAAAGPTAVDAALTRLARLHDEARVHTAVAASATGLDVVVELAAAEMARGRWQTGANVRVTLVPRAGSGDAVELDARLAAGTRSVLVRLPVTAIDADGARVRVRVDNGGDAVAEDEATGPSSTTARLGGPLMFRAGSSPRAPWYAAAEPLFHRTERLRAAWPAPAAADAATARLLDRRGEPLPVPVAIDEPRDGDRTLLAAELTLAPLAPGDYVLEVSVAGRVEALVPFRVAR